LKFLFSEDSSVQIKKLVELLPHSELISAALAVQAVQAAAAADLLLGGGAGRNYVPTY
jgi:hypothetical protein